MLTIAQTNIALFEQTRRLIDSPADQKQIQRAYRFALQLFAGYFRASEKPFVSHLVGTASSILAGADSLDTVLAALLHAAYAQGCLAEADLSRDEKRALVRRELGTAAELKVFTYDQAAWDASIIEDLSQRLSGFDAQQRDWLHLRLANELDDHWDMGICYCQNVAQRLKFIEQCGENMLELARQIEQPELATALARVFAQCMEQPVSASMTSTHDISFCHVESRLS